MWIKEKALDKLSAILAQAKINSKENTDDQALSVSALYPDFSEFEDGETLKTGTRLNYEGVLYKVLQDHQKQETWTPENAPSLYAKVLNPDSSVIPEWEQPGADNGYMIGDKVTHNGKTWESLVDNNVWEPDAIGTEALWKEI